MKTITEKILIAMKITKILPKKEGNKKIQGQKKNAHQAHNIAFKILRLNPNLLFHKHIIRHIRN